MLLRRSNQSNLDLLSFDKTTPRDTAALFYQKKLHAAALDQRLGNGAWIDMFKFPSNRQSACDPTNL